MPAPILNALYLLTNLILASIPWNMITVSIKDEESDAKGDEVT
jgi:hypothetical protein